LVDGLRGQDGLDGVDGRLGRAVHDGQVGADAELAVVLGVRESVDLGWDNFATIFITFRPQKLYDR
jgi:hypothetical protein